MTNEERKLAITYLEEMKESYIEGVGYERHPLPEYYAIENAIKALEQQQTIDYRRAFTIACELLSGSVLYGVDAEKIFEIMMQKDGLVSNESYERYILNHLQELDHGQYAEVDE